MNDTLGTKNSLFRLGKITGGPETMTVKSEQVNSFAESMAPRIFATFILHFGSPDLYSTSFDVSESYHMVISILLQGTHPRYAAKCVFHIAFEADRSEVRPTRGCLLFTRRSTCITD